MTKLHTSVAEPDPWIGLKKFTEARIAPGRCGTSLPLKECLEFKLAHAKARDAVHQPVQIEMLAGELTAARYPVVQLTSSVGDRAEYLTRPDKGRCLSSESKKLLEQQKQNYDIAVIIVDGLSAPAVHQSAVTVTCGLLDIIKTTNLTFAPVSLVKNGRVAIGDEIASLLNATISMVLIGERPGLSSPNSLGAYLTYNPVPGTTDEARNCISNIREGGLNIPEAIRKISYLIEMALKKKVTGVTLKDKMASNYLPMVGLISTLLPKSCHNKQET
ncbi:ethanolamine ammonia-lyase subunit EutC [Desulforhopalus sp. 52FAK]